MGRFSVEAVFKAVDKVTAPVSRMQDRFGRFTRSMEKGLKSVNKFVDHLGEKLMHVGEKIGEVAEKFAVLTGIEFAAIAETINSVAEATDELGKRAKRLAFPIEALQEWEYVAKQSGVSTEDFDNAIEKFSKNVGLAKMRTGPLLASLERYNPALLRQIRHAKDAGAAFDIYIKAIKKTKDSNVQAALIGVGFGKGAASMLNMVKRTTASIEEFRKEIRENGLATEEDAERSERYVEALNSLKGAFQGLVRNIVMPLLPDITEKLHQWREWLLVHRDIIRIKITEFISKSVEALKRFVGILIDIGQKHDVIGLLTKGFELLLKTIEWLDKNGQTVLKTIMWVGGLVLALKGLIGVLTLVNLVMAANPLTLILIGVGLLAAGIYLLVTHWSEFKNVVIDTAKAIVKWFFPVGTMMRDMWDGIVDTATRSIDKIMFAIQRIKDAIAVVIGAPGKTWDWATGKLGYNDMAPADASEPSIVSPQERVARSIEEKRQVSSAEVTIRDETGRATLTRGRLGNGVTLQRTGAFA